jgi:membrane-associated phospholipid phosphatase
MGNPLASLGLFTKLLPFASPMPRFLSKFLATVGVCGVGVVSGVSPAFADEVRGESPRPQGAPLVWNPAWPKFQTSEWVAAGLGVGALITSRAVPQTEVHWQGGILLDERARGALRVEGLNGRRWARDMSDIGLTLSESWPFLDSLVAAGWYRNSPEVGVQQALISAEVLAVTAGMQGLVSMLAGRERPYGQECGGELSDESRDCKSRDRYWSFYSGHASQAFAGATVTCMHHAYVPLYGGGTPDALACVAALGVAASTAFFRLSTDAHYLSDVTIGAVMGSLTGWLIPWAFHYRHGAKTALGEDDDGVSFMLVPTGLGASGVLTF